MPKIIKPLGELQVRNAKPRTTLYTLFDGNGLHVIVQTTGTRTFRLKTTIDGADRRITLGHYPDMSLAQAREKAAEMRGQIKKGIDPTAPDTTPQNTFKDVADLFIAWKESVSRTPATIRKYRECLKNDLNPVFSDLDIAAINTVQSVKILEQINKRSNSLAQKNKELITMIVRFACQRGLRPQHTTLDLKDIVPRNKPKAKPMITPSQFKTEIMPRINACRSPVIDCAIKLQFLTLVRAGEMMGAQWSEIDEQNSTWNIPAERMKMKRPHVVPLASQTLQILEELRAMTGGTLFLFPSLHTEKSMCRDALSKIFRDLGIPIYPHLCRTFAGTWMKNNGFMPHLIESQLSHANKNEVAGAYEHNPHLLYLNERRGMMQAWADALI